MNVPKRKDLAMNGPKRPELPAKREDIKKQVYDQYYASASEIEIVGVACNRFIDNLFPESSDDRERRLERFFSTPLFKNLERRDLSVYVLIANPFCQFVRIRAEEENNNECRHEILRNIERLSELARLLTGPPQSRRPIRGNFFVGTYDGNPYVSVFRAEGPPRRPPHFLQIGFLFQGKIGEKQPAVPIDYVKEQRIWKAVGRHLTHLYGRDRNRYFFQWTKGKAAPTFTFNFPTDKQFDVFFSYNARDVETVRGVELELRRQGFSCWFDRTTLTAGDTWSDTIEKMIGGGHVRAMAVFLGPNGDGPWQELEIRLGIAMFAKKQLKIIPVILKDVDGKPQARRLIDSFHPIYMHDEDWREQLVRALR